MINPHLIHRKLLPSIPVSRRGELPNKAGCYYVFRGWSLLYIGRAETSIRQRWQGHHKLADLRKSDRIHYWTMPAVFVRDREAQDINLFNPPLNARREPRDWRGRLAMLVMDVGCWIASAAIAWVIWRVVT